MFESDIQLYRIDDAWVFDGASGARAAQVAAVALFVVLASRALRRSGLSARVSVWVLSCAVTCGLAGAWLADGLLTQDFEHFGLSLAGAVVAGPLAFLLAAHAAGLAPRDALGALGRIAPASLGAAALARVGCLFSGCDFGAPTELPWGIRHGWGSAAWHDSVANGLADRWSRVSVAVHPFAAYEAALCVLAAAVAAASLRRGVAPASVALGAGAGYAVLRAGVENFRGGTPEGVASPVTAVAVVAAFAILVALKRVSGARTFFRIPGPARTCQEAAQ